MSCGCTNLKLAHAESGDHFIQTHVDDCWGRREVTLALRILKIFGAIMRGRIIDPTLKTHVVTLYNKDYSAFYNDAKGKLNTKMEDHILSFLDCHEYPLQLARLVKLHLNVRIERELRRDLSETSRWFWWATQFCSSTPGQSISYSDEEVARLELTAWKKAFGMRKNPNTGEVTLLSLMDILEEWSVENPSGKEYFDQLKGSFKLYGCAFQIFSKVQRPNLEWRKELKALIKVNLEPFQQGINRRPSRGDLRGSFSGVDLDSPQERDGGPLKKITYSKRQHLDKINNLTSEADSKHYLIAALLVEMKRMYWILPDTAWNDLYQQLYAVDTPLHIGILIYLSTVCMNTLFAPQNTKKPLEKWKALEETLHGMILKAEEKEFANFLKAGLFFSCMFSSLDTYLGDEKQEEIIKAQVFIWVKQGVLTDSMQPILDKAAERYPVEDASFSPLEALKLCEGIRTQYSISCFNSLRLWLHMIKPKVWAKPQEGRWLTLKETVGLIPELEHYCYAHSLTGEMILTLLTDHPLPTHVKDLISYLSDELQTQIIHDFTPFLSGFRSMPLQNPSGTGKLEAIGRAFSEGIAENTQAYAIRQRLIERIQRATLAESGYQPALLNSPVLYPQLCEGKESWLGYTSPYGRNDSKDAFVIGTWVKGTGNDSKYWCIKATFFHSSESPCGTTLIRPLRLQPDRFTNATLQACYLEFSKVLSLEAVPYDLSADWPKTIDYKDEDELYPLLVQTLKNINAENAQKALEKHVKMCGLEVGKADAIALFYFFIALKFQARAVFFNRRKLLSEKAPPHVPADKAGRISYARKGNIEALEGGLGATLMVRDPGPDAGDLFNISLEKYGEVIKRFIEAIQKNGKTPVLCEMEVLAGELVGILSLELNFHSSAKNLILQVAASIQLQKGPLNFDENLHLPLTFPSERLQNSIVILLARVMARFYEMNGDTK